MIKLVFESEFVDFLQTITIIRIDISEVLSPNGITSNVQKIETTLDIQGIIGKVQNALEREDLMQYHGGNIAIQTAEVLRYIKNNTQLQDRFDFQGKRYVVVEEYITDFFLEGLNGLPVKKYICQLETQI